MGKQLLTKAADNIKRTMISITAYTDDATVVDTLTSLLADTNIEEILIKTCPDFNEWMESLPVEQIPGLGDACHEQIRHWGIGGGDSSTESQIKDSIENLGSDVPKELANAMYNSVVDYSKTPFEASVLIMDIIKDSLAECEAKEMEN